MCYQKSCEALAAPPGGEVLARGVPGEREACLQGGAHGDFHLSVPEPGRSADRIGDANPGDRTSQGPLRIPQDPGAVEPGGLGSGQKAGVSLVSGRRADAATQATAAAAGGSASGERLQPTRTNEVWSLDFVADQLADGRRFRALTVVDVFTRESLAIEVGQRLRGDDVVSTLNQIGSQRGWPKFLFCDNGSEFTSQSIHLWAYQNGVQINYSRPGKPTDNAHVESFNGTLRAGCLDAHWFDSLTGAKQTIEAWRREYNESRPHRALGERTPSEFACQLAVQGSLTSSQAAENSP